MTAAWMVVPLVLGHLFGGMRSTTGNVLASSLTVVGEVLEVQDLADGASRLRVKVSHVPCGQRPATSDLTIHQMGDHSAVYRAGQVAVFPLSLASSNPHRVNSVPPDAWSVDQSAQETAWLDAASLVPTADALARLCAARGDERVEQLISLLQSPVPTLAGGAALDLMMLPRVPPPTPSSVDVLSRVLADGKAPLGIRVAAVTVAGRSHHAALEGLAAGCLLPHQPSELQAAAIRALQGRPDLLRAWIPVTLMGPPGPGRISAAKAAGFLKVEPAVGALTVLALGPEPDATQVACKALVALDTRDSRRALDALARDLPPALKGRCAVAAP